MNEASKHRNGVEVMRDLITPKPPVGGTKPGVQEYFVLDPKRPYRANEIPAQGIKMPTGLDAESLLNKDMSEITKLIESNNINQFMPKSIPMPPELVGEMTQEQWDEYQMVSYDTCETIYKQLTAETKKVTELIKVFSKEENKVFLPYCSDPKLMIDVMRMAGEDQKYLQDALDDVRQNYIEFIDPVTGKSKVSREDMTLSDAEKVLAVKNAFVLVGNQMTNLIEPNSRWLNDFYANMVLCYWADGRLEEAPADIQEYIHKHMNPPSA